MVLNINTDEGINSYFTENVFHSSPLPETPLGVKKEFEGSEDRRCCRIPVLALI